MSLNHSRRPESAASETTRDLWLETIKSDAMSTMCWPMSAKRSSSVRPSGKTMVWVPHLAAVAQAHADHRAIVVANIDETAADQQVGVAPQGQQRHVAVVDPQPPAADGVQANTRHRCNGRRQYRHRRPAG